MNTHLLNRLALYFIFLLIGLGACEKPNPEVVISGVIRAKVNGQPWESTRIVWGSFTSRGISYPGSGFSPLFIWAKGTNSGENAMSLNISANSNIFNQKGQFSVRGIQELRFSNEYYFAEPINTQMEILSADTLTRTIEGRFSFRASCCLSGQRERSVEVTDGYFKLVFP